MKTKFSTLFIFVILVSLAMPLLSEEAEDLTRKDAPQQEVPDKKPVQQAPDMTLVLLETVGISSGQSIYVTYMSIGSAADSFAAKVYDKDFTVLMLNEIMAITGKAQEQLNKLLATGMLHPDDAAHVKRLVEIYDLLIAEADGLKNFAVSGNLEHLKAYTEKKERAWSAIKEIMGIK